MFRWQDDNTLVVWVWIGRQGVWQRHHVTPNARGLYEVRVFGELLLEAPRLFADLLVRFLPYSAALERHRQADR